ncbi:hypothetical protein AX15_005614 [Amanita polypyramis BW_CC]|nr:hypothetical protein AX15_005614 [Amanita polypyramis BW_CC]
MIDRKLAFKLPPTTIRDAKLTQEARRSKALEEQKRRRAQRFDSARQLDVFADLTLSDEEEEDEPAAMAPAAGVASFVPAMKDHRSMSESLGELDMQVGAKDTGKKRGKKKRRGGRSAKKPSKWADKCMYAELLEMVDPGAPLFIPDMDRDLPGDGLPKDLETEWVAVTPVPVGKRCLAVTYQSSGVIGIAPNTTLRSRLLGKALITRFPSALPPSTILDCVLDANWKDNGILHVLDVIKWKGQDVGDCEARFRFWWRDTRLAEITQSTPPMTGYQATIPLPMVSIPPQPTTTSSTTTASTPKYQFSYPTTFLPIPYYTDTSLSSIFERIIPSTRTMRSVMVNVPVFSPMPQAIPSTNRVSEDGGGMDVDGMNMHAMESRGHVPSQQTFSFSFAQQQSARPESVPSMTAVPAVKPLPAPAGVQLAATAVASVQVKTSIQPDGLLLYVAEASYEPGTGPLSSWIPIVGYEREGKVGGEVKPAVKREGGNSDAGGTNKNGSGPLKRAEGEGKEGPLDLFERLVKQRLERKPLAQQGAMDMDM